MIRALPECGTMIASNMQGPQLWIVSSKRCAAAWQTQIFGYACMPCTCVAASGTRLNLHIRSSYFSITVKYTGGYTKPQPQASSEAGTAPLALNLAF